MGELVRDLRLAVRQALKNPGFTLAAVVTLGLGIGAAVVPLLLVAVALLASLLSARRATRVDPLVVLRAE